MEIRRDYDNSLELSALFPGFRFCPTDEELISHYLKGKIDGLDLGDEVIPEVEICKFEPWDLPAKSIMQSDHEWFFFSPSGKKYPNGSQAKRATEVGFWKATGKERNIKSGANVIGTKRTLVFHIGRAPKGERTCWIMHEYCIKGNKVDKPQDSFVICRLRKNLDFSTKNNSPNSESASQIGSSPTDIGLPSTSHFGSCTQKSQMGVHREGKAIDCCSMNQTSGSGSLSINPPDSTGEFVPRQPNEIRSLELESEINQEDTDVTFEEDDCFVDILKDDIIKLDDPSLPGTSLLLPVESKPNRSVHTFIQGTARRRIKLEVKRAGRRRAELLRVGDKISVVKINQLEAKKLTEDLLRSNHSFSITKGGMLFMLLVIMVLFLVSFLLVLRGT